MLMTDKHKNVRISQYWTPEGKLQIIKEIRELTGASLMESKLYVEALEEQDNTHPVLHALDKALDALRGYRTGHHTEIDTLKTDRDQARAQVRRLEGQIEEMREAKDQALDQALDEYRNTKNRLSFLENTSKQIDKFCDAMSDEQWGALITIIADELDPVNPDCNRLGKRPAIATLAFLAFLNIHHNL